MSLYVFQLTPNQAAPFEKQIKDNQCRWDNTDLSKVPISAYPHFAGWTVEGLKEKQGLFKMCPKCGYDWALWKLGVNRE